MSYCFKTYRFVSIPIIDAFSMLQMFFSRPRGRCRRLGSGQRAASLYPFRLEILAVLSSGTARCLRFFVGLH